MGYFANGCEGDDYQNKYCENCLHWQEENACAVMLAHLLHNYDECNKKESVLHLLIPRDEKGGNQQCTMFVPVTKPYKFNADLDTCDGCEAKPAKSGNHHAQNCARWTL